MPEFERTRDRQAPAVSGGRAEPPEVETETPEAVPAPESLDVRETEAEAEELEEQERRFTDEGGAPG